MTDPQLINRREAMRLAGLAAVSAASATWLSRLSRAADIAASGRPDLGRVEGPRKKLLFFTKSSGFEHSVIARKEPDKLAYAEQILTDMGAKHGYDVTCSKDGGIFAPARRDAFDAFVFYTTGDLTTAGKDGNPPMSAQDKAGLLEAIHNGKGFVGLHSATDTFLATTKLKEDLVRNVNDKGEDDFDPYIKMLGGEFIKHGVQQPATLHCVDDKFPGASAFKESNFLEEWYSLKNYAPDLHVILVQETQGMKGVWYQRKPYPATWARMHGSGRVFYTSLGHREDVWKMPAFEGLLFGALDWAVGRVDADVTPNIKKVTPGYDPAPFPSDPTAKK